MARPTPPHAPGATYHVWSHAVEDTDLLRCPEDGEAFLARLERSVRERGWTVLAYCLMPNHVHVLVRTRAPDLSAGMQEILGDYARSFNERHGRRGALFRSRYDAKVVETDEYLLWLLRYIARNPVKHGFRRSPLDWRWSSHLPIVSGVTGSSPVARETVLEATGGLAAYLALVHDDDLPDDLASLVSRGTDEALLFAHDVLGISVRAIAAASRQEAKTLGRRLTRARAAGTPPSAGLSGGLAPPSRSSPDRPACPEVV
jgi:REP element-mobilizing transposase RayT